VPKDHMRLEAYGTIDELNAALGVAKFYVSPPTKIILEEIQHQLFNLGVVLASAKPAEKIEKLPPNEETVQDLEKKIDQMDKELETLETFILPGASLAGAFLDRARTVCRRAERRIVRLHRQENLPPIAIKFINRLGDFLFILERWENHLAGAKEKRWQKK